MLNITGNTGELIRFVQGEGPECLDGLVKTLSRLNDYGDGAHYKKNAHIDLNRGDGLQLPEGDNQFLLSVVLFPESQNPIIGGLLYDRRSREWSIHT